MFKRIFEKLFDRRSDYEKQRDAEIKRDCCKARRNEYGREFIDKQNNKEDDDLRYLLEKCCVADERGGEKRSVYKCPKCGQYWFRVWFEGGKGDLSAYVKANGWQFDPEKWELDKPNAVEK